MNIGKYGLVKTSNCCPEQYDVFNGENYVGYLRLRHGLFSARVSGETVFSATLKSDGSFEEEERLGYLTKAVNKIDEFLQKKETNSL